MGKVNRYREYVQTLLSKYAADDVSTDEVANTPVFKLDGV